MCRLYRETYILVVDLDTGVLDAWGARFPIFFLVTLADANGFAVLELHAGTERRVCADSIR